MRRALARFCFAARRGKPGGNSAKAIGAEPQGSARRELERCGRYSISSLSQFRVRIGNIAATHQEKEARQLLQPSDILLLVNSDLKSGIDQASLYPLLATAAETEIEGLNRLLRGRMKSRR